MDPTVSVKQDETETVRKLTEKLAEHRRQIARQESDLIKVLLTLDETAHLSLRKGIDYDDTLASAMSGLFGSARKELRVAIPYLTLGGMRDFAVMMDSALAGEARVDLLFRYPEREGDIQLQSKIHDRMRLEITSGKLRIRYLGRMGSSGLHAKVIVQDDVAAIISSANWTGFSLSTNAEAGIMTSSVRVIRMLQSWFDYLYENSRGWSAVTRE